MSASVVRAEHMPLAERVSDQHFDDFIAWGANHEAKLVVEGILLTHPDVDFTRMELANTLLERQYPFTGWENMSKHIAFQYCEKSLQRMGTVSIGHRDTAYGQASVTYAAPDENSGFDLASVGFLSQWSLEHPELSVQTAFGFASGNSKVRSPVARYRILRDLLQADTGKTTMDIARGLTDLGYSDIEQGVLNQINLMRDAGLVLTNSRYLENDPLLKIVRPEYVHRAIKFENISPEYQAIYRTMAAVQPEQPEILLSEFLRTLGTRFPDINLTAVRGALLDVNSKQRDHIPGLELADPSDVSRGTTHILINPELRPGIESLVTGLEALRDGYNREDYARIAQKILDTPEDVAALMAKGQRSSAFAERKRPDAIEAHELILHVLSETGPLTATALREQLKARGRNLKNDSIQAVLRVLARNGVVEIGEIPVDPELGIKRKLKTYGALIVAAERALAS